MLLTKEIFIVQQKLIFSNLEIVNNEVKPPISMKWAVFFKKCFTRNYALNTKLSIAKVVSSITLEQVLQHDFESRG